MRSHPGRRSLSLLAAATLLVAACGGDGTSEPDPPAELELSVETTRLPGLPGVGAPGSLDVGTWNLEWFGDQGNGPVDEELQLANIAYFIQGLDLDVWAVQEVTSAAWFDTLLDRLEGYDGLLANDPAVIDGPAYYSDFNDSEQKVGLVYRGASIRVDSARVILGTEEDAFAGRPPVQLHLALTGASMETPPVLVVVLLHARAGAQPADREDREAGAAALKAHLDERFSARPVLVVGDFNDDVDASIASGASPYAAFVDDPAGYRFITAGLSAAGESSTATYDDMIDHHLATDDLAASYVDGSAAVFPAPDYLAGFAETTSDHYPVVARYGSEIAAALADPVARARLRWTGASTDRVDIYRQGSRIVTTDNDGRHLDDAPVPAGGTATYRVCEAASQRCSDDVVADFR